MRVAFVVQRYGIDINGGAELHCRWIVERMKNHWDIQVLTTRALDYITWQNHYPESDEIIHGVPIKRFPVLRTRNPQRFGRLQNHILQNEHSIQDELEWLDEEGPFSPELIRYIDDRREEFDYFIFFSYRYYHSFWGVNVIPRKSILVPTAERDPVIHLSIFKRLFRKPRAFIYNSLEEKAMIQNLSQNIDIRGDVVGVGSVIPDRFDTEKFRQKYGIDDDYIIFIGRIDENKGCDKLFDYFLQYKDETASDIKLILAGSSILEIPDHPDIRYLGFISEEDKFSGLNGALLLVMPSFYESLSMVTLEAWALGKPVLANAHCDVLRGQCMRSQAGLYYEDYPDFRESLDLLLSSSRLRDTMGRNGRKYFNSHYTWDIIEKKYLKTIEILEREGR